MKFVSTKSNVVIDLDIIACTQIIQTGTITGTKRNLKPSVAITYKPIDGQQIPHATIHCDSHDEAKELLHQIIDAVPKQNRVGN